MRIARLTTLLKASPAMLAMFGVAFASGPGQAPKPEGKLTSSAQLILPCPPLVYNPNAFPNLLQNDSFNTVGPNGTSTTFTGIHGGGNSAAASWGVWHNTQGTTRTRMIPGNAPGGGPRMLHVYTTGGSNGISQAIGPYNTGSVKTLASAYVYVKSGKVCIGTGNGGNTHCDGTSATMNQWKLLKACNGVSPANTFIVYSVGGSADFYVDLTRVTRVQ